MTLETFEGPWEEVQAHIPDFVGHQVRVTVLDSDEDIGTTDQTEWLTFIQRTAGCLADDPISRPPQGEYETRDWPPEFFQE